MVMFTVVIVRLYVLLIKIIGKKMINENLEVIVNERYP